MTQQLPALEAIPADFDANSVMVACLNIDGLDTHQEAEAAKRHFLNQDGVHACIFEKFFFIAYDPGKIDAKALTDIVIVGRQHLIEFDISFDRLEWFMSLLIDGSDLSYRLSQSHA